MSAIAAEELPPSYFNLTPDDYHRLMAQRQRSEGTQPQTLKTRALREAEELRKAREAGVVHIRYLLPDAEVRGCLGAWSSFA